MTVPKAYLDNNVVCEITKDDLPAGEPEALTDLLRLYSEEKLSVVTSQLTWQEMESGMASIARRLEGFSLLKKVESILDHTVHGFANQDQQDDAGIQVEDLLRVQFASSAAVVVGRPPHYNIRLSFRMS